MSIYIYSARLHCKMGPPAFHVPWQVASYPAHTEQNVMWPPVSCQLIGLRARPHRCLPTVIWRVFINKNLSRSWLNSTFSRQIFIVKNSVKTKCDRKWIECFDEIFFCFDFSDSEYKSEYFRKNVIVKNRQPMLTSCCKKTLGGCQRARGWPRGQSWGPGWWYPEKKVYFYRQ